MSCAYILLTSLSKLRSLVVIAKPKRKAGLAVVKLARH